MIIGIIIGLLIWFVVPMFFTDETTQTEKEKATDDRADL